jgi:RNA polymerase sigma-70 factor (ECF subfamily)
MGPMDLQDSVSPGDPNRAPSDRTLLRRLRGGSEDAATQLYLRYAKRLRGLIRSRCSAQVQRCIEPEDLVQSVFRRFFRRVRQGDYDVPAGEELWGLFLVIALNRIRAEETFQRASKRDLRRTVHGPDEIPLAIAAEHDENSLLVLQLTIGEALEKLPSAQRQMLELRIQGHEVAEIARLTGRAKRTVERNLQEVRTHLRSLLEEKTSDEPVDHVGPDEKSQHSR